MLDEQTRCTYVAGTKVWAKLKGYPWWPGQIADRAAMPDAAQSAKRQSTCVPVLFYGSDDYGWVLPSDVKLLGDDSVTPKRQGKLLEALRIAEMDTLPTGRIGCRAATIYEGDGFGVKEYDRYEATDAPSKKAGRRPSSKKKEPPASGLATHKNNGRDGSEGLKDPHRDSRRKCPRESTERPRSKRSPYERLMFHRHRVQKMMKDCPELLGESAKIDEIMSDLEGFPMTLSLLKETKVGKLMKRLTQQEFLDEHNIRERATALIRSWKNQFHLQKERGGGGDEESGERQGLTAKPTLKAERGEEEGNGEYGIERPFRIRRARDNKDWCERRE